MRKPKVEMLCLSYGVENIELNVWVSARNETSRVFSFLLLLLLFLFLPLLPLLLLPLLLLLLLLQYTVAHHCYRHTKTGNQFFTYKQEFEKKKRKEWQLLSLSIFPLLFSIFNLVASGGTRLK